MPHTSPEEIRIQAGGLDLAALVSGPEEGSPVLAMHGWLDNAATFTPLRGLLPPGLRLVAIDLPGHGRSEHRRAGEVYHFIDWVRVVLDVADALQWPTFTILGHSMGAAIAALVGGTAPERIARMVWIDGLGPWAAPDSQAPAQLARSITEHRTLAKKHSRKMRDPDHAAAILSTVYADLSPRSLHILLERGLKESSEGVEFSYDLKLRAASPIRLTEAQVLAFLEAITAPVLFIRPEHGWPADPALMQRRREAVKNIHLVDVEGGHHVHLEHPDRLAAPIAAFLTQS